MQKIVPFLWFDNQAEEAMNFYVSIFSSLGGNSKVVKIMPGPNGKASGVTFELQGQEFYALNGGPQFKFTEAISFFVNCETQGEIDELWEKLSNGGEKGKCGWLKDKYGVSWQIIPTLLSQMLQDKDPVKAQKVMKAMLQMDKIYIAGLTQAYEQE